MKTLYTTENSQVKANYTIRIYGRVWHVRMSHDEVIQFLRWLAASRSAA